MDVSFIKINELGRVKRFTYAEACTLVPVLLRVTRKTQTQIKPLVRKIPYLSSSDELYLDTKRAYQSALQEWADKVIRLGCEVKGIWTVDMDCGYGYFCWQYPEEDIRYFHKYNEAFHKRRPLKSVAQELNF